MSSKIIGSGSYLPQKKVFLADLAHDVPPYVEQLQDYFGGVEERGICSDFETNIYMGRKAAEIAIENAKISPDEIDLVLNYSMFTDYQVPRDGNFITSELGLKNASSWHIDTTCSSFLTSLKIANSVIQSKMVKTVLIITPTNWVNRGFDNSKDTRCLGDGAAAIVLRASDAQQALLTFKEMNDIEKVNYVQMCSPIGSTKREFVEFRRDVPKEEYYMQGLDMAKSMLAGAKIFPNDIDWVIVHQPGVKAVKVWCEILEMPEEKNLTTVTWTGNISAANIPFVIDHYTRVEPKIKRGDKLFLFSPGGGMHFSSLVWQY